MIGLAAGDFRAAQTAAAGALDALRAQTGRSLHRLLHGATEGNSLFELRSDVLSDELCVEVGAANLDDVQSDALAELLLQLQTELFNLLTALADDDAGTGAVQIDLNAGIAALDLDLGDACGIKSLLEILTDVIVLNDQVADLVVAGIPAGIPVLDYADAQTMRINFLSHSNLLMPSRSHRW